MKVNFSYAGLILVCAGLMAPLSADPVPSVHYQLNGSSLEANGMGKGSLKGFGADPFISGHVGPKALRFVQEGQSVALPSFYKGSSYKAVSVSAWINTLNSGSQSIVSYDRGSYWHLGIGDANSGPGKLGFSVRTNNGVHDIASLSNVDDGSWHHVLAVFDGRNERMEIFIDGVSDNSVSLPGSTSYGSGATRFGYLGVGSKATKLGGAFGPNSWFLGDLDDVRVYSSAIAPAGVAEIFVEDRSATADAGRSTADRDADGIANKWEIQNGLNPDEDPATANDADSLTPDNEGSSISATYLQQYRAGADPTLDNDYVHPAPLPVATASVISGDAFELEGVPATLRITVSGGSGPAIPVFYSIGTSSDPNEGASDPADYTVTDSSDTPLDGFVMVDPNGGSADIVIHPVEDVRAEYPEVVELSIDNGTDYAAGGSSSARCLINDATDTPENVTTFKAVYTPELGLPTSGTGFATLTINGPKTEATIFTSYSGLTSIQTDQHIHRVNDVGSGGNPAPDFNSRGPIIEQLDETTPNDDNPTAKHVWTLNVGSRNGFTVTEVVDSLFRQDGFALYCNVHTATNLAGEIWAFFEEFEGAVAISPTETAAYESPGSVTDLPAGEALRREVVRFLTQTTWGPRNSDIDDLYNEIVANYEVGSTGTYDRLGAFQQWMTDQLALDQTSLFELVWALDEYELYAHRFFENSMDAGGPLMRTNQVNGAEPAGSNFEGSMWSLFSYSHDQFRQRIAYAFSQIWVISRLDNNTYVRHYGAANWWDDLGASGTGTFRDLLEDVSKSPMMGFYLSHLKNETIFELDGSGNRVMDGMGNPVVALFPDENFAREIQQLFSIGLLYLLPDGRIRLDSGSGQPVQTYSNVDIENLARVFTGWSHSEIEDSPGVITSNNNFFVGNGSRYLPQRRWRSPMKCFDASNGFNDPDFNDSNHNRHDPDPKTIYAGTDEETNFPANQSGQQDLDRLLDTLRDHPNTAPFISKLLIKRFVTSNPSPGYVYRVAKVFSGGTNSHTGSALVDAGGTVGDMEKVIRAIIMDHEARDLSFVDSREGSGKSKEPALVITHAIRALNAQSRIPIEMLTQLDSGPDLTVTPGSGNVIPLPVSGEGSTWLAMDYPAGQFDNFPADASIIHFTSTNPGFGQSPMSAPTVFNFYLPDFTPGGQLAVAGLTAPELQLATETQVMDAINFTRALVEEPGYIDNNSLEGFSDSDAEAYGDFSEYVAVYDGASGTDSDKATALVDYLDLIFCAGTLKVDYAEETSSENPRQYIIDSVTGTSESTLAKVKNALYLVVHSPAGLSQR
ncbi:DUF1800 family protein [Haloferula sp.]|uniref:DUF1800 family protein n=1 Tax=Haloferula sp. TaxID=2497595 RepID=UPI0032A07617